MPSVAIGRTSFMRYAPNCGNQKIKSRLSFSFLACLAIKLCDGRCVRFLQHKGTVAVLGPEIKFGMGHHSKPSVRCCTRSQPGLVRKEYAYSTRIRSGNVPPQSRDRRGFESSSARQHQICRDRLFAFANEGHEGADALAEIP